MVVKQLHDQSLKVRDVGTLPIQFQDHLFACVFGWDRLDGPLQEPSDSSMLLNLLLALEDTESFTDIAFESWAVSLPQSPNKDVVRLFPNSQTVPPLVAQITERFGLTSSQNRWLNHASRAVPDWSVLLSSGPWNNDARIDFMSTLLSEVHSLPLELSGFLKAHDLFHKHLIARRSQLPGSFFPNLILLVEGETEMILLPHFAKLLGYDFSQMGVMISSAGGAKQVARRYFELRDVVKLPIVSFVDADAGEEVDVAQEALRESDRLHIWKEGEIEDTLDAGVLVNQLNAFLQTSGGPGAISYNDFPAGQRRTAILNKLWRARGLGNFDKIGFAELIASNMRDKNEVPKAVAEAIRGIEEVLRRQSVGDSRTARHGRKEARPG